MIKILTLVCLFFSFVAEAKSPCKNKKSNMIDIAYLTIELNKVELEQRLKERNLVNIKLSN